MKEVQPKQEVTKSTLRRTIEWGAKIDVSGIAILGAAACGNHVADGGKSPAQATHSTTAPKNNSTDPQPTTPTTEASAPVSPNIHLGANLCSNAALVSAVSNVASSQVICKPGKVSLATNPGYSEFDFIYPNGNDEYASVQLEDIQQQYSPLSLDNLQEHITIDGYSCKYDDNTETVLNGAVACDLGANAVADVFIGNLGPISDAETIMSATLEAASE